jgi:hypothetical protein
MECAPSAADAPHIAQRWVPTAISQRRNHGDEVTTAAVTCSDREGAEISSLVTRRDFSNRVQPVQLTL